MNRVKCVMVGDTTAEKTSMCMAYTRRDQQSDYVATSMDFMTAHVEHEGKKYDINIFDTASQEDYDRLRPLSYPQSNVFLVCFSLIDPMSFESVSAKWVPEVRHHMPNVPLVLVGTNLDKRGSTDALHSLRLKKMVPITEGKGNRLAKEINAFGYVECSLFNPAAIDEVFETALKAALFTKKK